MRRPSSPSLRSLLAGALAAAALAGCSADERETPERSTTTAPPAAACPAGPDVPPAEPAGDRPTAPDAAGGSGGGPGLDVVALLPRTGELSFLGGAPIAAAQLAVAHTNAAGGVLGQPVRLRVVDSAEGTPGAAEGAVASALAEGADAVVGPLSSAVAATVLDDVVAADAVLVTPGATADALDRVDGSGRLFRTVATESLQGAALADLVLDEGARTVAMVVRADDHGRTVASAFADALAAGGGSVGHRIDHDPTAAEVDLGPIGDADVDATVLVGLADMAPVVDALVAAGRPPEAHPTYGTDGMLGDRFAGLVADPSSLRCLGGLLAVAPAGDALAADLRDRLGPDTSPEVLDHAAETYDAVVLLALAAEAAGDTGGGAIGAALLATSRGGATCDAPARCLEALRAGRDVAYVGRSGPLRSDDDGNRTAATLTRVAFDGDGRLVRIAARTHR